MELVVVQSAAECRTRGLLCMTRKDVQLQDLEIRFMTLYVAVAMSPVILTANSEQLFRSSAQASRMALF